ncbi:MAG: hypothetical protein HY274_10240 [Gammaproteobacteria bacterium]|nr:hypothetical protein [Gammaproteobacteria bacterium]
MNKRNKMALLGATIHLVAWFAVDLIANWPPSPPVAGSFHEFLPWWSALYFGYVFNVTLAATVPLAIYLVVLSSLESWFEWNIFFYDVPSFASSHFWLAYLLSFLLFASPIVVNTCIRWLQGWWGRKFNSKS